MYKRRRRLDFYFLLLKRGPKKINGWKANLEALCTKKQKIRQKRPILFTVLLMCPQRELTFR